MKISSIVVISLVLLTGCSNSNPTLTVQNMTTGEQMQVPGVQSECPPDEQEWAEELIKNFYSNGYVGMLGQSNGLIHNPECFNDAVMTQSALNDYGG